LRPHEPALLQSLGDENQSLTIPDKDLEQVTSTPTKAEDRAAVRILRQHRLHLRR
jgi:hypothetical protein